MQPFDSHCARCMRPAPDEASDVFLTWEALGPTGDLLVCEDCLTPGEQQAMDDDMAETQRSADFLRTDDDH